MKKQKTKNTSSKKDPPLPVQPLKKKAGKTGNASLLSLSVILLLGIIVYSNTFTGPFHFDDNPNLVENKAIQDLSNLKALWNFSPNRFIAFFSFALNYHFGGLNVWGYHFVNLLIHLSNAVIVYWLTLLIFSCPALKGNPATKHRNAIAFVTALLFVSHPLATQSVTYIVQRIASLVTLFYLLSLALYVKGRITQNNHSAKYLFFAGSLISALLALFTKENAYTLPLVIVLFEIFFLQTKKFSVNFRDYRIYLFPAVFLAAIVLVLTRFSFSIFKPIPPSLGNNYTITSLDYFYTQFSVIVKYIQLLVLPVQQNLDYDYPLSHGFFEARTLFSFIFLLALVILGGFLFKKNRVISFGIFWFFLTLAIESSFVPINDVIFEHRTYLPSFGFFLALSFVVFSLLWNKYKTLAISILGIIMVSNAVLTFQRNEIWGDDLALTLDVVSKSPNKARPNSNLGSMYMDQGQFEKAIPYFNKVIEVDPNYFAGYNNLGAAYEKLRQYDKAIANFNKAIEMDPKFFPAYASLAGVYLKMGQSDKAISYYTKAIEADPKSPYYYSNRGMVYGNLGQTDKALADFSKAIEADPKFAEAYYNRGSTYGNLGQFNKALDGFSRAIEVNPAYKDAYFFRGLTYNTLGQWDKAVSDFSKTIEIDPNFKPAYTNRDFALSKLQGGNQQQPAPKGQ